MLDAARAAGVRYVDVARSYGRAEEFLARWLAERGVPRDAVTVGSKWGYRYTAGWTVDAAGARAEGAVARPLPRAARRDAARSSGDRLALYQIHSATAESGALDDTALLARARRGATRRRVPRRRTHAERRRRRRARSTCALAARVDGEPVFDVVQATFNILEPSLAAGSRAPRTPRASASS